MLDKSLPYVGVIMINSEPIYQKHELPQGYTFCFYDESIELEWVKLLVLCEQFESFGEAINYIHNMFETHESLVKSRMIFVKDPKQNIVATCTLWAGHHFGKPLQRLHFLCVNPEHEGKGIAKALVSKILELHKLVNPNEPIYLTTQTWSYPAINIYLSFGFIAYLGEKPVAWNGTKAQFDKNKVIAWELIMKKINEYNSTKISKENSIEAFYEGFGKPQA